MEDACYVLPLASVVPVLDAELSGYLRWLSGILPVIVVDGSPPEVFDAHHRAWGAAVTHIPPEPGPATPMGKVGGVMTGVRAARGERLVIADDDVRYRRGDLERVVALLGRADVVRPQNAFDPLPWHAAWDSARILLNRLAGGDWPGTLGVRRSAVLGAGGYAGDVLFENLELVRTLRLAGGREVLALDLIVPRLPPSVRQFWSQRVRQAYDEWARPWRLAPALAVVPLAASLVLRRRWAHLAGQALVWVTLAEAGRRRGGGRSAFPLRCSLWAPVWVVERGVCAWLAVAARLRGGVRYRGVRLARAATPRRELARRRRAGRVGDGVAVQGRRAVTRISSPASSTSISKPAAGMRRSTSWGV